MATLKKKEIEELVTTKRKKKTKKKVTKKKGETGLDKWLLNEFEMELEGQEVKDTTPYYIKFLAMALQQGKKVIGIMPTRETRKNRDSDQFMKTTFKVTWKDGIDPWYGLVELLEIEDVIKKVKGKKSKDKNKKQLYQYKKKKFLFNDDNIGEAVKRYPSMLKRKD